MNRRELITGLVTLVAAPAIVRAGSLMPVKMYPMYTHELLMDERIYYITEEQLSLILKSNRIKWEEYTEKFKSPWQPWLTNHDEEIK